MMGASNIDRAQQSTKKIASLNSHIVCLQMEYKLDDAKYWTHVHLKLRWIGNSSDSRGVFGA